MPTSFTKLIVILNGLVFAAMIFSGANPQNFDGQTLINFGANFTPATLGGQPWRLLTYQFVHGDIWHIFLNMFCLWNLGQLAEQIYGEVKFLVLYIVTGIGAGIASLLLHPVTLSVGASGAIFGIAGVLITTLKFRKLPIPDYVAQHYFHSVLRFAGMNLVIGFALPFVDNSAHIGGVLTGLALGFIMPLGGRVSRPDDF